MSDDKRIKPGEPFQGKSKEPLIWGEVDFQFPFWKAQPEPSENVMKDFRQRIDTLGVRVPISIRIGRPFSVDEAIECFDNRGGEHPTCVPPTLLKIEDEQLVKVPNPMLRDIVDVGPGKDLAKPAKKILPVVAVIDGEMRLRAAVGCGIPLEQIPFRHYQAPPQGADDEIKSFLSNKQERAKYDQFTERQKEKFRIIFAFWLKSWTTRGGMSDEGYQQYIYTIDRLFHGQFKRLSDRKMARLLGHSGPGRNKVGCLRREIGGDYLPGNSSVDAYDKLKRMRRTRDEIKRGARLLEGVRTDYMYRGALEDLDESDRKAHERYIASVLKPLKNKIKTIEKKIDDARDTAYDEAVAGGMGQVDAFFESTQTVSEILDEIIFDEIPELVSTDYSDFVLEGDVD